MTVRGPDDPTARELSARLRISTVVCGMVLKDSTAKIAGASRSWTAAFSPDSMSLLSVIIRVNPRPRSFLFPVLGDLGGEFYRPTTFIGR